MNKTCLKCHGAGKMNHIGGMTKKCSCLDAVIELVAKPVVHDNELRTDTELTVNDFPEAHVVMPVKKEAKVKPSWKRK